MKNVKAYVRTTLTAGLILAAAVLGGCSKSDAGSSAADTAAASSGTESAASADASNSNKKELKYGKAAGPIRNKQMAEFASQQTGMLIAFWDGKSRGTGSMIRLAKEYGLEVHIVD